MEHTLGFIPEMISELSIDGVIGVRSAVENELGWSCLPSLSIVTKLRYKTLSKLDLECGARGDFSVWHLRSKKDSAASVRLMTKWLLEIS